MPRGMFLGYLCCSAEELFSWRYERDFHMRLILFDCDTANRIKFHPLALSRPIWELRTGMSSLADKLIAKTGAAQVSCFVPPYMAEAYRQRTDWPVNDLTALSDGDLLIINPRVRAESFHLPDEGPSQVGMSADGEMLWARVCAEDAARLNRGSIDHFLSDATGKLPNVSAGLPTWDYTWDLLLANGEQLTADFAARGRSGIEGTVEQPNALRGGEKDIYVAPGARIHPMVVLDATDGPIYIDEGAEVQPFTRIEGPCYVGRGTILLGAKCRAGTSIGPVCRVGGEVEESIILGYSNKYHDGFLGHAYVGEWVNLGALTSNSDLKNDYSNVTVVLDGESSVNTGTMKLGAMIADHTKTAIGVLLKTGAYVGGMSMIVGTGGPLTKFLPAFTWLADGVLSEHPDKDRLYKTAKTSMERRGCCWTAAEQAMWDEIYLRTAPHRKMAVERSKG